ncbi:MAG: PilZ domain-containing protein [Candidatus Methylomirabilales bacterium]
MRVEHIIDNRRRHARLAVGGRLEGRISATRKRAHVVDISRGGALVEHLNIVSPQSISFLVLFFPEHEVRLKCRALRSQAHRYEVWPSGERGWVYRTALEFLEAPGASPRVIGEYISDGEIDSLIRGDWIAKDFEEIP